MNIQELPLEAPNRRGTCLVFLENSQTLLLGRHPSIHIKFHFIGNFCANQMTAMSANFRLKTAGHACSRLTKIDQEV